MARSTWPFRSKESAPVLNGARAAPAYGRSRTRSRDFLEPDPTVVDRILQHTRHHRVEEKTSERPYGHNNSITRSRVVYGVYLLLTNHEKRGKEARRVGPSGALEVVSFDFEYFSVMQEALHDLQDRFGEAHAEQGVLDLGMSVDLPKFEQAAGDLRRILTDRTRQLSSFLFSHSGNLTVISVYSPY